MQRANRFGDRGELISGSRGEVSFFGGKVSDARMDIVRQSIPLVRAGWAGQTHVPDDVRAFIASLDLRGRPGVTSKEIATPIEQSFALNRDWDDRLSDASPRTEFPMIRHYTSDLGYSTLFTEINARYRSNAGTSDHRPFLPLTWLIELLNMELFAAARADPARIGDRVVHRGTVFPGHLLDHYAMFEEREARRENRSISIPLGLHSATGDKSIAQDFIRRNRPEDLGQEDFGVIWTIHIVSLAGERLDLYHHHYPRSVVSSICATDISGLSSYKEAEVLLRGPFFEVLGFRPIDPIEGLPTYELHAVMLNSNRDHVSTYELGDQDAPARELFGKLIAAEKYAACAAVATSLDKGDLASQYSEAAKRAEEAVSA